LFRHIRAAAILLLDLLEEAEEVVITYLLGVLDVRLSSRVALHRVIEHTDQVVDVIRYARLRLSHARAACHHMSSLVFY
jgi:hypothetical protein